MQGRRGRLLKLAMTAFAAAGFVVATSAVPVSANAGVSIEDNFFSPAATHIDPTETITWTWNGVHNHSTTSDTGIWDSGIHGNGHTFPRTFSSVGIFKYHCNVHSNMHGTIYVGKVLTVSRGGSGAGSVTSSPSGINCPSTCQAAFATSTPA